MSGKDAPFEFFTLDAIVQATGADRGNVNTYWPHIAYALDGLGLWDVPTCMAAIATVRVEAGGTFAPIHEYGTPADWASYDGGPAYAGRGFIQLTHRYNYATYGQKIGVDLVNNPDKALDPSVAAWVLAYYFRDHATPNMQALAQDAWLNTGDWSKTRIYVQGGMGGWDVYAPIIDALGGLVNGTPQPAPDPCADLKQQLAEAQATAAAEHAKYDALLTAARAVQEAETTLAQARQRFTALLG